MGRPIRLLTFTALYPNARRPAHGVFVENRLRHLLAGGEAEARVVAPVPWHRSAGVPRCERRHGIEVWHPRYPAIPKVGMSVQPLAMAAAALGLLRRLAAECEFDAIDAHYFYPDGVAAALLGRALDKPVVVTGRGTDLSLIPRHPLARAQIRWAAGRAAGLVTVCKALKRPLLEMGVPAAKVRVLRNGVDLARFRPTARDETRRRLGLDGPTLLSVGLLIERKGHHLAVEALEKLPGFTLLIAGEGPERPALERLAARPGLAGRVRLLGEVAHESLPELYSAADALVLASSREGWANVLLESMACGTAVAATDVWGTAEAVSSPEAGVLIPERTPAAIADSVRRLFAAPPAREAVRRHAEQFGWEATTQGQLELFREVLPPSRPPPTLRAGGGV